MWLEGADGENEFLLENVQLYVTWTVNLRPLGQSFNHCFTFGDIGARMYLGSRSASVARWPTRPELLLSINTDGYPIHQQPNKLKLHYSGPSVRSEEIPRFDASPLKCRSLTEYQHWPKSEFELVTEEEPWTESLFDPSESISTHAPCFSEWSISEVSLGALSKKGSMDDAMRIESDCDDGVEVEPVYNRHVNEMKVALPMRTTVSTRCRQMDSVSFCRSSGGRRRVHPIGKFTDELVNWIPENGTDEEKEDNDRHDVTFEHCMEGIASTCNGSHSIKVEVKQCYKRGIEIKNGKRKRRLRSDRKEGIHRRRKQHNPWSVEETQMLIKGVAICGEGRWADIKRLDFTELASRSPVDLKDKWRNLLRLAQPSNTQARTRKVQNSHPLYYPQSTQYGCKRLLSSGYCALTGVYRFLLYVNAV